jgi:hypothetical protein
MRKLLPILALAAFLPALPAAPDAEEAADVKAVQAAGVGDDGPALLAFFKSRTLTEADQRKVEAAVKQLSSDEFEEREKATQELMRRGRPALAALRKAAEGPDLEVARRALDCIAFIEDGPGAALPSSAARLVARRSPAGAVPVLLAYLPFADDEATEDEVLAALLALTPPGKADAALAAALRSPQAVQRGAAAHVLGRKGDAGQRDAVAALLADKEARVRFRAALALLTARDPRAVPALIDLVADGPVELAWQVEEVLFRLAGDDVPAVGRGDDRGKWRDGWRAWWKEKGEKVDLALFADAERLLGLTLAIEYNTGRVWECGPDGKLRVDIQGLQGPMEAQILPGGRVLIAESNNRTVSVRDLKGAVLWSKVLDNGEPTGAQRLPNGNTFVSTYGSAMEFDAAGKKLYDINLGGGSNAIRKARNGNILYASDAGEIVELNTAGNRVRSIPIPKESMWVGVQELPGDRFMVCNSSSGKVLEVDAKGKVLWEAKVQGACGVCRLPNGHTLVGTANRVVELDRFGRQVWERKTEGYVRRVHRR